MARHAALEQKLKGAEYTLDHKGQVILIKPMNPAKMPSNVFGQNAKFKLSYANEEAGKKGGKKGVSRSSSTSSLGDKSGDGEKKKKNKKGSKTVKGKKTNSHFSVQTQSLQTPAAISLTGGVSLTFGGSRKDGGKLKSNNENSNPDASLTLSQYNAMLEQKYPSQERNKKGVEATDLEANGVGANAGGDVAMNTVEEEEDDVEKSNGYVCIRVFYDNL